MKVGQKVPYLGRFRKCNTSPEYESAKPENSHMPLRSVQMTKLTINPIPQIKY